ncbi:MAG TPA: hypothetical protein VH592_01600, partial [Gemmataceae bacterium]
KGSLNHGLYDPRRGDQAIRSQRLNLGRKPFEPVRTNYFSVYLIESGSGTFWADASHFSFGPASLLFFVPYQHIRFVADGPVHAEVIQFHANFLCVETLHAEVGCSGVLFNDPYGVPRHHDGCGPRNDGRLGEGVPAKAGGDPLGVENCRGGTTTDEGQRVKQQEPA